MRDMLKNDRGSILLVFIITLPFLILVVVAYTQLAFTSYSVGRSDQFHTSAQLAADAGVDYAIQQITNNNLWPGTIGETLLQNDGKIRTTYTASVSSTSNLKTISVTGKTYWPVKSTTPRRSVSLIVDLRPVTSGSYSVVSGAGGLFMSNSSKIVGGDVYVNGEVQLSNTAQIGLSTTPVNVHVAHQTCPVPANSTYPRVCNNGENGEPISISNQAKIYGEVRATNQTNGSGMSNPGLIAGSSADPLALPTYDRAAQKAAVVATISGSAASCSGSQTRTWAANTKITGNVDIGNQCKVTVLGNVWITGNLNISNSAQMIVSDTLGATRPNIMVDGSNGAVFSNSSKLVSNTLSTGFYIYTFYSTASCSPDCTSVTGTDLANSRSITTIALNNSSTAPNSIFYSYWTQVTISNSGQIGALVGQTIRLSNTGTITFGSSTGTANTVWVPQGYRRQ